VTRKRGQGNNWESYWGVTAARLSPNGAHTGRFWAAREQNDSRICLIWSYQCQQTALACKPSHQKTPANISEDRKAFNDGLKKYPRLFACLLSAYCLDSSLTSISKLISSISGLRLRRSVLRNSGAEDSFLLQPVTTTKGTVQAHNADATGWRPLRLD
jgi:hypothetical protein